jgi:hypothetical protein
VAGALVFGRQTEMGHQQEGVFALCAEFDSETTRCALTAAPRIRA